VAPLTDRDEGLYGVNPQNGENSSFDKATGPPAGRQRPCGNETVPGPLSTHMPVGQRAARQPSGLRHFWRVITLVQDRVGHIDF
jgi:hypothetical protein